MLSILLANLFFPAIRIRTPWGIGVSPQKTRAFLFSLAHGSHGYLGSISFPIPATPRRAVPSRFWIGDMTRFFTRQLLNRPSPVRRRMAMCLGLNSTMLRVPRVFSCIPNGVGWPVGLGSCEIINGVSIPLPQSLAPQWRWERKDPIRLPIGYLGNFSGADVKKLRVTLKHRKNKRCFDVYTPED